MLYEGFTQFSNRLSLYSFYKSTMLEGDVPNSRIVLEWIRAIKVRCYTKVPYI